MMLDQLYQQALEHNDKVKQLRLENFKLKEQISVLQQEQYKTDSQIKLDKDIMDNNMLSKLSLLSEHS